MKLPNKLVAYHAVVAVCLVCLYIGFDIAIGSFSGTVTQVVYIIAEGLLVGSLLYVLRGWWRLLLPSLICCVTVFMYVNVVYYRFNGDIITPGLVFDAASYNTFVVSSGVSLMRPADLVWLVPAVIAFVSFGLMHVSAQPQLSCSGKFIASGGCVALWIGAQFLAVRAECKYWQGENIPQRFTDRLEARFSPELTFSNTSKWHDRELLVYLYHQVIDFRHSTPLQLTPRLKESIERNIDRLEHLSPDAQFEPNSSKNLIFIVAESLNADAIGTRIDGRSVTPTLDSLLCLAGTVSALNVASQVQCGNSSDGQFIYNTGLLPLRGDALAMSFPNNSYPSLARAMGYDRSTDVIVEPAGLWNHADTYKGYGYDRLVHNLQPGDNQSQDACMFARALAEIDSPPRPFMVELVTLTMHHPFTDPGMKRPGWICGPGSERSVRYLMALNEFDTALARFLRELHLRDIYENSVIVIASDHDKDPDNEAGRVHDIVFIALNTGKTLTVDRRVQQVDVYPTVLEIMNRTGYPWPGLGQSMIAPDIESGRLPSDSLWALSEQIIRTDYFANCDSLLRHRLGL